MLAADAEADARQLLAVRAVVAGLERVDDIADQIAPQIEHLGVGARQRQRERALAAGRVAVGQQRVDDALLDAS